MLESAENMIAIPNTTVCTVRSLLRYLYQDSVPDDECTVQLLHLAHQYQVAALEKHCVTHLLKKLSSKTWPTTTFVALLHAETHPRLIEGCLALLRSEPDKVMMELLESKEWKALNQAQMQQFLEKIYCPDRGMKRALPEADKAESESRPAKRQKIESSNGVG